MDLLHVGDAFPAATLEDDAGKPFYVAETAGKWRVFYFYPKAMTPGCTIQAKGAQAALKALENLDVSVYGVSADAPKKLHAFKCKEGLTFNLLGDAGLGFLKDCGVWVEKKMYGRTYMGVARVTYVIDPQGRVAKVFDKVDVGTHWEGVLGWLKTARRAE